MEKEPFNEDDRDRSIPERERLDPGEIDLTGTVRQDGMLRDVIGDALVEMQSSGGTLPDWGARVIARMLANRQETAVTALHHFAVTGKADVSSIAPELENLRESGDDETTALANLLGDYIVGGSAAEQESPVPPTSERQGAGESLIDQGIRMHGSAFRAYLQLPDTDRHASDLVARFQDLYIGSFDSMHHLVYALTDAKRGMEAISKAAEEWGLDEFITLNETALAEAARATWDIVTIDGTLYVFTK
jgi:hypothetical protein